jgi:hypothetical protein
VSPDLVALQRRTVRVLASAQVLGGVGVGAGVSVGGLIAEDVSGSTSLSGLAQTSTVLGAAVIALPMARTLHVITDEAGEKIVGLHLCGPRCCPARDAVPDESSV